MHGIQYPSYLANQEDKRNFAALVARINDGDNAAESIKSTLDWLWQRKVQASMEGALPAVAAIERAWDSLLRNLRNRAEDDVLFSSAEELIREAKARNPEYCDADHVVFFLISFFQSRAFHYAEEKALVDLLNRFAQNCNDKMGPPAYLMCQYQAVLSLVGTRKLEAVLDLARNVANPILLDEFNSAPFPKEAFIYLEKIKALLKMPAAFRDGTPALAQSLTEEVWGSMDTQDKLLYLKGLLTADEHRIASDYIRTKLTALEGLNARARGERERLLGRLNQHPVAAQVVGAAGGAGGASSAPAPGRH